MVFLCYTMSNKVAQLKAFHLTSSVTECPNGHSLEKTDNPKSELKLSAYENWICDDCNQTFHVKDVMPHHCSKCEYDLCNNCVEKTVSCQMEIPLRQVKVTGQIDDWLSDLTLHQFYKNDTENDLEAIYVFPIDPDAAIYRISAKVGERTVEAVCKEREEAKREYKEAINRGQFATLGSEARGDLFELSVGRISPNETVEITVSYVLPLSFGSGFDVACDKLKTSLWQMSGTIPLTAFPRYQPKSKSESGSGSSVAVDLKITNSVPYRLDVDLEFSTSLPICELKVPSHQESSEVSKEVSKEELSKIGLGLAEPIKEENSNITKNNTKIEIEYSGEHTAHLRANDLPMNRDFRFELWVKPVVPDIEFESLESDGNICNSAAEITAQVLGVPSRVEINPKINEGTSSEIEDRFSLAGVLPIVVTSNESAKLDQPTEIIFVLDCSGSMQMLGGTGGGYYGSQQESVSPISRCAELLRLFAHSLPTSATFNVIRFGSTFTKLFEHPQPATSEYRAKAVNLSNKLEANLGGTDILAPLVDISRTPVEVGRVRQVIILTDGAVSNTQKVIRQVSRDSSYTRYFSIGIGEGCSRELVKGVAEAGRGSYKFVSSGDLAPTVMTLLEKALRPAVTDWTVEFSIPGIRVATNKTYPIFMGQPGLIYYFGDKTSAEEVSKLGLNYTLKGKLGKELVELKGRIFPSEVKSSSTVHRLAAKCVITELERDDEYGTDTDRGCHLKREVTSIGTVFNLASRETSFVGVESSTEPSTNKIIKREVPLFRPIDRPYSLPQDRSQVRYGSRGYQGARHLELSSMRCSDMRCSDGATAAPFITSTGLGINTIGTSLRIASHDLRSAPSVPSGGFFGFDSGPKTNFFEKRASSYVDSDLDLGTTYSCVADPDEQSRKIFLMGDKEESADFSTSNIEIYNEPEKPSLSKLLAQVGDDDLFKVNHDLLKEYGLSSEHSIWSCRPDNATAEEWFSVVVLAYLGEHMANEKAVWGLVAMRVRNCLEKKGKGDLLGKAEDMFEVSV